MDIEKEYLQCRGKMFPAVHVYFSDEESERHDLGDEYVFTDYGELFGMVYYTTSDENTKEIRDYVDDYVKGNYCAAFCEGRISENIMKFKVARIMLSWPKD